MTEGLKSIYYFLFTVRFGDTTREVVLHGPGGFLRSCSDAPHNREYWDVSTKKTLQSAKNLLEMDGYLSEWQDGGDKIDTIENIFPDEVVSCKPVFR